MHDIQFCMIRKNFRNYYVNTGRGGGGGGGGAGGGGWGAGKKLGYFTMLRAALRTPALSHFRTQLIPAPTIVDKLRSVNS
jgi:hypothetical protein